METILLATLLAVVVIAGRLYGELCLKVHAGRRQAVAVDTRLDMVTHLKRAADAAACTRATIESIDHQFARLMAALERIERKIDQLPDRKGA